MKTTNFLPFLDLIQVSPDGEYVIMDSQAVDLPLDRFSELVDFIRFAFDHPQKISQVYPVTASQVPILALGA